ncbi:Hypothetical protein LUCI_1733 [Lucifera butyrica]|uniref:Uncharacterized protein n=1 Tax=Lucifera butyrica TaxID=1351585 RepID=A0A498R6H3_9FIRM|nr:Hypothetical protein LUCI_1733 [Lucifera butyrica]
MKEPPYKTGTTGVEKNTAVKKQNKQEHTVNPPSVPTQHF